MRRFKIVLLMLLAACALCGCSQSRQVENQAYVLTMGLDKGEEGLEITVQTPKIASGGGEKEASSGSGGGKYVQSSAKGKTFEDVIEKLDWAIPRALNLSHLKLIVLSEELAANENGRELIYDIVHTERLFSAARLVVCEGSASDFIKNTKPVFGSRLSVDVMSAFDHYASRGYVPDSNLADFYYATESVYGDPMAAYAIVTGSEKAAPASALGGSISEIAESAESEVSARYLGAALFSEGICKGVLDGADTIYANLLKGTVRMFRYAHDGQGLEIFPAGKASLQFDLNVQPIRISVDLPLNISAQENVPDLEGLKAALEQEIEGTIRRVQQIGVDPFGFADQAAGHFLTLDAWIDYGWKERFSNAEVSVNVKLKRTGA